MGLTIAFGTDYKSALSDLAWGTLQEASIFNEKYKDGDPAKEIIINRYACEAIGGTVESGTSKQQTAIGKPCN